MKCHVQPVLKTIQDNRWDHCLLAHPSWGAVDPSLFLLQIARRQECRRQTAALMSSISWHALHIHTKCNFASEYQKLNSRWDRVNSQGTAVSKATPGELWTQTPLAITESVHLTPYSSLKASAPSSKHLHLIYVVRLNAEHPCPTQGDGLPVVTLEFKSHPHPFPFF